MHVSIEFRLGHEHVFEDTLGAAGGTGESWVGEISCDTSCKSELTPPKPGKAPKGYQKG